MMRFVPNLGPNNFSDNTCCINLGLQGLYIYLLVSCEMYRHDRIDLTRLTRLMLPITVCRSALNTAHACNASHHRVSVGTEHGSRV